MFKFFLSLHNVYEAYIIIIIIIIIIMVNYYNIIYYIERIYNDTSCKKTEKNSEYGEGNASCCPLTYFK